MTTMGPRRLVVAIRAGGWIQPSPLREGAEARREENPHFSVDAAKSTREMASDKKNSQNASTVARR
jgi:hypothetical protein